MYAIRSYYATDSSVMPLVMRWMPARTPPRALALSTDTGRRVKVAGVVGSPR